MPQVNLKSAPNGGRWGGARQTTAFIYPYLDSLGKKVNVLYCRSSTVGSGCYINSECGTLAPEKCTLLGKTLAVEYMISQLRQ